MPVTVIPGVPHLDGGLTVSEIYCNNCGHQNTAGANFCSSCGAVMESSSSDPVTITFFPSQATDPVDDDVPVDAIELTSVAAALVVRRGPNAGSRYQLEDPLTTVGRDPSSAIFLDDVTVSRRHAEVEKQADGYMVRDVGSLNGTYVNRVRVDHSLLANGDELQIGAFKLSFFGPADGPGK
jgi:pSer/pThr/pTyr-binding forkhead associated (FHA) protein